MQCPDCGEEVVASMCGPGPTTPGGKAAVAELILAVHRYYTGACTKGGEADAALTAAPM